MANFCARCGRPLPENGICECQIQQQRQAPLASYQPVPQAPQQYPPYQQPQPTRPAEPSAFAKAFKNLLPFLRGFVADPVAAVKTAVAKKEILLAVIIAGVLGVASFFSWLTASVGISIRTTANISFISPFFGLLAAAALVILGTLGVFLGAKLSKKNISFLSALTAVGCACIVPAAVLAVAVLLNLWFPAGLLLAILFGVSTVSVYCIALQAFECKSLFSYLVLCGFGTLAGLTLYLLFNWSIASGIFL